MPCLWPRRAWRDLQTGSVTLRSPSEEWRYGSLHVPCGGCLECRVRQARDWAIRCTLELKEHPAAAWVTLTYADEHLVRPTLEWEPTLYKPHLSGYLKRLRERVRRSATVRFFGVGEYGDTTHRPHYHVILYGVAPTERAIEKAWPFGHVRVEPVSPANIAYTAGYANKKIRPNTYRPRPYVDPETGELFEWQEAFRLTSRRPGIGGAARRHARSWRDTAIHRGRPVPVPRYLHNAWRDLATDDEVAELDLERQRYLAQSAPTTWEEKYRERDARDAIAQAKHKLQTENRTL